MNKQDLVRTADLRRADVITMIVRAKAGHIGGAMSCLDALTCLFYHTMNEGDHFLLSKGHSTEGYWAILADKGYFPKKKFANLFLCRKPTDRSSKQQSYRRRNVDRIARPRALHRRRTRPRRTQTRK